MSGSRSPVDSSGESVNAIGTKATTGEASPGTGLCATVAIAETFGGSVSIALDVPAQELLVGIEGIDLDEAEESPAAVDAGAGRGV